MSQQNLHEVKQPVSKKNKRKLISSESGVFFTGINILNVIIGSGIITLPVSMMSGGTGMTIILLVISAIAGHYASMCLSKMMNVTKLKTYQELIESTLGIGGLIAITICQILKPLFAILSYGIVIGDNLEEIFRFLVPSVAVLQNRYLLIAIPIFGIIFPLAACRNIAFLDKVSFLSISCVIYYFSVVMAMSAFLPNQLFQFDGLFVFARPGVPQAISLLSFAYGCHQTVPAIYRSMRKKSSARFAYSNYESFGTACFLYIFMASVGFITFAGNVQGNLLNNYCPNDKIITSARIIFTITIMLTCPLQIFACREGITTIAYKWMKFSWWFHVLVTFCICLLCFAVSSNFRNLGLIVEISGAITGAPITYILPATGLLFAIKQGFKPDNAVKIGCWIVAIFGVFISIIGIVMISISAKSHSVSRIRYWCDVEIADALNGDFLVNMQIQMLRNAWTS